MTDVYVLHVFTDEHGNFGDIATVIFDEGRRIPDEIRERIAKTLQSAETAFVNNAVSHKVSFVHSQGEIDFAGVPALGVAWLLGEREGKPISRLEGRGGRIIVSHEDNLTWISANLETMPPWNYIQLADASAIDRITLSETVGWDHTMVWSWADKSNGIVRARTFASDWDIPEAQGNGSGSMLLAAQLGCAIEIRHGKGSVMYARPASNGSADIGARVSQGAMLDNFSYDESSASRI